MPAISIGVNPDTGNMTLVRVAPTKRLTMNVSGFHTVYEGALLGADPTTGDQVMVPNYDVQYLRRDGIII